MVNLYSNLFWCVIGAVISFLISLLFFYIGSKRKHLSYNIKTSSLVSNKINQISGLEIKYHSNDIKNLYYSTITIKNIGNSIIEKSDFSSPYPIVFLTSGQFLVDISKQNVISPKIKQSLISYKGASTNNTDKCNILTINFEYLSKKQELNFTVFHTENIKFCSIIKDGKIVNEAKINSRKKRFSNIINQVPFILYFVLGFILGFLICEVVFLILCL